MRWPREDWVDAVWASDLRPLERLVALAYARRAGSGATAWMGTADLLADTGLSRNTARNALRGLVAAGWLDLVERERQQYAARYRLVRPVDRPATIDAPAQGVSSAPAQGVSSAPAESPGGQLRTRSGGHLPTPGGEEVTPGGEELTPKLGNQGLPPLPEPADDLWAVMVAALPPALGTSLTRTQKLTDACRRLAFDGWTSSDLREATERRPWNGAEPGAVVTWLSGLDKPPRAAVPRRGRVPDGRPKWCGACDSETRLTETDDGMRRCPACHPLAIAVPA